MENSPSAIAAAYFRKAGVAFVQVVLYGYIGNYRITDIQMRDANGASLSLDCEKDVFKPGLGLGSDGPAAFAAFEKHTYAEADRLMPDCEDPGEDYLTCRVTDTDLAPLAENETVF